MEIILKTWVPGTPRGYGKAETGAEWLDCIRRAIGVGDPQVGPGMRREVVLRFLIYPGSSRYRGQKKLHGVRQSMEGAMGIELGEDYLKAARENVEKGVAASKRDSRHTIWTVAIVLTAWIAAAHHYGLPDGLMISVTVAIGTMCLLWALNWRIVGVEADIIYAAGAIEWFGQKHLDGRNAEK